MPTDVDDLDVRGLRELEIQGRDTQGAALPSGVGPAGTESKDAALGRTPPGDLQYLASQLQGDQRSDKSKVSRNSRGSRSHISMKEGLQMFKISSKS